MQLQIFILWIYHSVIVSVSANKSARGFKKIPEEYFTESGMLPSQSAREHRAISSATPHNLDQCTGNVLTLAAGDGATLNSHRNYGIEPYPSDYQV